MSDTPKRARTNPNKSFVEALEAGAACLTGSRFDQDHQAANILHMITDEYRNPDKNPHHASDYDALAKQRDALVASLTRAYNDFDHIAADTASDVDGMTRAGISDFADKCAKRIDATLKTMEGA